MTRPQWLIDLLDDEIVNPIESDPRTRAAPGTYFGCPQSRVFHEVVEGGQADFDASCSIHVGSKPVTVDGPDRALLYAKYNQPGHLIELDHAFGQLFDSAPSQDATTVLDLGCGPFTAGLALAARLGPTRPFRYFGVDRAATMRRLAERLAGGARARGALHPDTSWSFAASLSDCRFDRISWDPRLVVVSYLFASPTLDPTVLGAELLDALTRIGRGETALLYTNSGLPHLNVKWPVLRDQLVGVGFKVEVDETEVFNLTRNPRKLRYALLYRPKSSTLTMGGP